MLGECGETEACGARTAARNRYEEAHFNWRTCSHSMRTVHRVEQLAQTAATCSWERSTCSHSMRTVSRSSLGPLPPSCRRCPRPWPRHRCHSSSNSADLHTEQAIFGCHT